MKKRCILAVIICLIFCYGCGGKTESAKTDIIEKDFDISELNFEGKEEQDQPYWNVFSHRFARGDYGYYYMNRAEGGNMIYHIDDESYEMIPLCSKADCNHANPNCYAYFGEYIVNSVWRYKDNLYVLTPQSGQVQLVRVSLDGSEREELFEIGPDEDSVAIYNLAFCNDCVFIYNRRGNSGVIENIPDVTLRMRSLDGKRDVNIYTMSEQDSVIDAVKVYEDKVFFLVENITLKKGETVKQTTVKGLYCYDIVNNQVGEILDKNISDYSINTKDNVMYYYVINEGLYKYDCVSKEDKKIMSSDDTSALCQVSCDNNNVYLSNERWSVFARTLNITPYLWVLDKEGTVLNTIETGNYYTYFGDDKNILFSYIAKKNNYYNPAYIKKTDITTAETWVDIE